MFEGSSGAQEEEGSSEVMGMSTVSAVPQGDESFEQGGAKGG